MSVCSRRLSVCTRWCIMVYYLFFSFSAWVLLSGWSRGRRELSDIHSSVQVTASMAADSWAAESNHYTNLYPQACTLYLRQFNIDSISPNTLQTKFLWRPTPSVWLLAECRKFVELWDTVSGGVREILKCRLNTLWFYKTSRRSWQVWLCTAVMQARWQVTN